MTQSTPELLPVVQADRDAAADFARAGGNWLLDWDAIRRGELDETVFVQSFARHRIEHAPQSALGPGRRGQSVRREPEHTSPDRNAVLALGATLDVVDELYRKYEVELDAADILIVRRARDAHQSALTTTPEPTDEDDCGAMGLDELGDFVEAHRSEPTDPVGVSEMARCESCNVPLGVGACRRCHEARCGIAQQVVSRARTAEQQVKHMTERFLQWKLPADFNPDAGISFKAEFNEHTAHPMRHEPTGTNLLSYAQAEAMVLHMIEGLPVLAALRTPPVLEVVKEREQIVAWLRAYAEKDRYGPRWRPLHYVAAAIERGEHAALQTINERGSK